MPGLSRSEAKTGEANLEFAEIGPKSVADFVNAVAAASANRR
jgi:hypothetical protein